MLILLSFLSALLVLAAGEDEKSELRLSLDDAIAMARVRSVDAAEALDELRSAYWEWRTFRADQLPELKLDATVPSYDNQYSSYMDEEGNFSFVRTNTL